MFQATMRCYLWDLVDEGIENVLDRLKGEAGITGISVPLACPPIEQLRPHKGVSPRTFRSRGGVQFQPHAEFYANTRLRPVVAEWLRKSNPLPAVAEACAKRGMTLRGEINCCHAPVMVEKYPFAGVKDVFGEANPKWLCPANPDVVEYLGAQIEELASLSFLVSLEFQCFQFPHGRFLRLFLPAPQGAVETEEPDLPRNRLELTEHEEQTPLAEQLSRLRQDVDRTKTRIDRLIHGNVTGWLMSLCFCESCRQVAGREGIAMPELERAVLSCLEQSFHSGEQPDDSITELISGNDHLARFLEWRGKHLENSMRGMRQRVQLPLLLCSRLDTAGRDDELRIVRHVNGLVRPVFNISRIESAALAIKVSKRRFGEALPLHLQFCTWGYASPKDSTELVRGVSEATQNQVVEVIFDHYGGTPMARLAWIKQAVRKAQRDLE